MCSSHVSVSISHLLIVVVMRWGGAQSRVVVSHKRIIAGDAVVPALLANGLARLRRSLCEPFSLGFFTALSLAQLGLSKCWNCSPCLSDRAALMWLHLCALCLNTLLCLPIAMYAPPRERWFCGAC